MKIQIDSVDWNKSDAEIARQFNCVPSAACKRRHQLGIAPAKNYPRKQLKHAKIEAKLSERKTVHEWLNKKGIPKEEFGKPICLLRRLAIALEIHSLPNPPSIVLKVGSKITIDGEKHIVYNWGHWTDPTTNDRLQTIGFLPDIRSQKP